MTSFPVIPVFLGAVLATAVADDSGGEATVPAVTRVDDNTLRIGKITFRPDSREIRVPARVNMTEGLLEFALVHTDGKVHESLLVTDAGGTNLNLALKLLRYRPSEELFPLLEEDGSASNKLPDVPAATRAAARADIRLEWQDGPHTKSAALHEWITHAATERPMPAAPWVYGGSYVLEGRFAAEADGDLIAIFVSQGALFNYAGADNDNDEVWIPTNGRVPPAGTAVTVVISPPSKKDS